MHNFFAALLLTSAKSAISVTVEPAVMLLMPLVVGLLLVGVGYMLAFLDPVDGADLARFFASAAVVAALDASEHVSSNLVAIRILLTTYSASSISCVTLSWFTMW